MNLLLGYHALSSGGRIVGVTQALTERYGFSTFGPGTSITMCSGQGWPAENGRVPVTVQSRS